MSVKERDPYTGHMTTGHEWNGIKELNTPVPWVLIFFLVTTFLFSIVYWLLMPSFPSINSFAKGALGVDQKDVVIEQLNLADAAKASWADDLTSTPLDELVVSDELKQIAAEAGPALYKDNCAMCHGQQGQGELYFPRLTDEAWLWGGTPADIYKTLQVGINSGHEQSRVSQMAAFGETGVLNSEDINNVVLYVQSLSNTVIGDGSNVSELLEVKLGKAVYSAQCVACHGANGEGNPLLGAPVLSDSYWIYGGDKDAMFQTIWAGRAGHMPYWDTRLSDTQLRLLSLYVASLSADVEAAN